MKVLDLFSGIGGFSLGLERAGMETVAFCEIEPFCQRVLAKHWPNVPIFNDVNTITEEFSGETVELICGGYPCQPFSVAGKRKGKDDDRHLWPAMFNCIKFYKPTWVVAENVAGHVNMGLDEVLSDLESKGYEATTFIIPACAVDAPHRRDRVWIIANASTKRCNNGEYNRQERSVLHDKNGYAKENKPERKRRQRRASEVSKTMEYTRCELWQGGKVSRNYAKEVRPGNANKSKRSSGACEGRGWEWISEPDVGRVANGIPNRVDRLRGLGNAVVPQIPEIIGRAIMEIEKET